MVAKKIEKHIIENVKLVRREARKHIITAITAGFGFLIALSWKDAITTWVNSIVNYFKVSGDLSQLVAALIVTIVSVTGIIIASKFEEKPIIVDKKETKLDAFFGKPN